MFRPKKSTDVSLIACFSWVRGREEDSGYARMEVLYQHSRGASFKQVTRERVQIDSVTCMEIEAFGTNMVRLFVLGTEKKQRGTVTSGRLISRDAFKATMKLLRAELAGRKDIIILEKGESLVQT